ncbi:MAG TPA: hypothetical protein VGE15_03480 [Sphingobacteriaceae bacterium]
MLAAVITGDIIHSTGHPGFLDKLQEVLKETSRSFGFNTKNWEIYRGDSFQCVIENPEEALMVAMCIRAGLRSKAYYPDFADRFDAKIAIGIGEITSLRDKPGESAGTAFLYSGRKLDELQEKKYHLAIHSDFGIFDPLADTVLRFIDDTLTGWSDASADTACYHWFGKFNQEQLAERLGISQPAVNKRLHTARIQLLEYADKNFKLTLQNLTHDRTSHTV